MENGNENLSDSQREKIALDQLMMAWKTLTLKEKELVAGTANTMNFAKQITGATKH
jgi:hypothetical protein